MDQNHLETLNPVYSSMIAQTHQYFNPFNGYDGSAVNFWPQMLFSDQESEYASRIECQPLKRPRISNTTMKTKMVEQCLQFKRGYCTYGQNCQFAHDRESYVIKNWDEDDRIISKMKLCRRFCNGDLCPYGQRCHFLHEAPGKFRKGFAMNNGNTGPGGFYANGCEELGGQAFEHLNVNANQVYQKIDFRKTRLCNKWEATGNCPFGVKCNFAHGQAELQKLGSQIGTQCEIISTSKLTSAAATHASHCGTENQSACDQQMMGEECLFKWKSFKKLNGIYADWIDEMPLVYSSLGKVGN